jgi:hypothetical protein
MRLKCLSVLPGLNHFSVVTELTRAGSRLNALAKTLVQQKPA